MTHPERDPDLLLFAHGVLPPLRGALLRRHLARCPDCRRRMQEFQAVSHGLAASIRDPQMPRWPRPMPSLALPVLAVWLIGGLALLTIILGTLVVQSRRPVSPQPSPSVSMPCRPGLPSDRCR